MTKEIEAAWETHKPETVDPLESIASHMFAAFKAGWLAAQSAPPLDDADALDRIEKIIKAVSRIVPVADPIWCAHDGSGVQPPVTRGAAFQIYVLYKNGKEMPSPIDAIDVEWSQVAKWRFSSAKVHPPVAFNNPWSQVWLAHDGVALVPMSLHGFAGDVFVEYMNGGDCVAKPDVIMWSSVKRWRYA